MAGGLRGGQRGRGDGTGTGIARLVAPHGHRCRMGTGVAEVAALHGRALHERCCCTGTWAARGPAPCGRWHGVGTAGSRAHVARGSAGASAARALVLHEHRHGVGVSVVRARCTGTRVARVHGEGASVAWAVVLHGCQHCIGVLHGHQRCKGAGVAWVPALHGHWSCRGGQCCTAALHGHQRCMGADVAWMQALHRRVARAPALHGCQRGLLKPWRLPVGAGDRAKPGDTEVLGWAARGIQRGLVAPPPCPQPGFCARCSRVAPLRSPPAAAVNPEGLGVPSPPGSPPWGDAGW